eukprot:5541545-Karenia_brevis.AAC.1
MLAYAAVPRANHTLRTLPPSQVQQYAKAHDDSLWKCFCGLMGASDMQEDVRAQRIATMPGRQGGLGL